MNRINYLDRIEEHIYEIHQLREQRDAANLKIFKILSLMKIETSLVEDPHGDLQLTVDSVVERLMSEGIGLTDIIRTILRRSPREFFTPTQIRDELIKGGFSLAKYKSNPLNSIHSVIKRLLADGEVSVSTIGKEYQWNLLGSRALQQLIQRKKKETKK